MSSDERRQAQLARLRVLLKQLRRVIDELIGITENAAEATQLLMADDEAPSERGESGGNCESSGVISTT